MSNSSSFPLSAKHETEFYMIKVTILDYVCMYNAPLHVGEVVLS